MAQINECLVNNVINYIKYLFIIAFCLRKEVDNKLIINLTDEIS